MLGQRTCSRKFRRRRVGRPRKVKTLRPKVDGARPGFEGTRKLCKMMIENPDQWGKYVEVTKNLYRAWSWTVKTRTELDSAQEKAGDRFQYLYEKRSSNNIVTAWRAGLEKKKNRCGSVPIRALTTGQQLAELQCLLGRDRFRVLELICGLGLTLHEAGRRYFGRNASRRDEAQLVELLLEVLDQLALHWGYAGASRTVHKD